MEHDAMDKYGQVEVYPYGREGYAMRWVIRTIDIDQGGFVDTLTVDFGNGVMSVAKAREYIRKLGVLCDMAEKVNELSTPAPVSTPKIGA